MRNLLFCMRMRKFAFTSIVACVAGLFATQGFAQPRDLFAEFEAEAAAEEAAAVSSSSEAVSSSSVDPSSSSVKAASSSSVPAPASSSSVVPSSSSLAVSSSSVAESSSSVVASSSSVEQPSSSSMTPEEEYAAQAARAYAEKEAAIRRSIEEAKAAEEARRAEIPEDSTLAVEDSIMRAQDALHSEQEMDMPPVPSSSSQAADSAQVAAASSSSDASVVPSSSSLSRRDLLGPVKVSKVNGIDEMKGRYKNPRKALFMSLVVPGSGQLYVGGSTFTNVRGGVYLALEAALWSGWYYFSVYKYDQQVSKYKKFAKEHYSIGRYERGMRDLYSADAVNYEAEFRSRYLGSRESFCEAIYGDAKARGCFDRTTLYHNDANFMTDFVNKPVKLGSEMKNVHFEDKAEVYSLIADASYVLGWDDVEKVPVATSLNLEDPSASKVSLGDSDNRDEYRSLRSKANDYADMQAWFFGGLILNHIISAVDAAFTANAHNKTLYQEDLSWYDHLHFDSGVSFFDGFGFNVQASWGF